MISLWISPCHLRSWSSSPTSLCARVSFATGRTGTTPPPSTSSSSLYPPWAWATRCPSTRRGPVVRAFSSILLKVLSDWRGPVAGAFSPHSQEWGENAPPISWNFEDFKKRIEEFFLDQSDLYSILSFTFFMSVNLNKISINVRVTALQIGKEHFQRSSSSLSSVSH